MREERRHKGTGMVWAVLGALGLAFWASSNSSAAVEAGTSNTPPPTTSTTLTNAQLLQSWVTYIHNLIASYGYAPQAEYVEQTSGTEIPVDTTAAGRNLVLRNQAVTDLYMQFFWSANGALVYHTWDPNTDAAGWASITSMYTQLLTQLTPQFLT